MRERSRIFLPMNKLSLSLEDILARMEADYQIAA